MTKVMDRPAALPTSSDKDSWTPDEAAAIEAAGLVFTYPDWSSIPAEMHGTKVLAPRPIVQRFLHSCVRTGLDPLARQIYCIPRLGRDGIEWAIQTAIDGFRVIAERSQKYAGQDAAEWLTADGDWVDVWIREVHGQRTPDGKIAPDAHPLAARVRVYRHDWRDDKPAVGIATWDEYAQTKSNGSLTAMWQQRGPGQLAKCAEALALRKAFPQDLSGLYTADELAQAGTQVIADADQDALEAAATPAARKSRVPRAQSSQDTSGGSDGTSTADEPETAPSEAVELPVDYPAEVRGGICARCGQPEADEDGMLCGPCELEVEAEIAAEQEGN